MSKRITLNNDQVYVLAQMVQDALNNGPSTYWSYKYFGQVELTKILKKLEDD